MKFKVFPILLATTFLTTNALAETPEVNVDYLNSLSSPNITWELSDDTEENTIEINGKYYKYIYNNTDCIVCFITICIFNIVSAILFSYWFYIG